MLECLCSGNAAPGADTMKFLSLDVGSKKLDLKTLNDLPVPEQNDVRVRVAYAGICGTDLHILNGLFPIKPEGSVTLGHEFSGTVDAVGSAVRSLKVGQKVAVDPNSACNMCDYCHNGNYHLCNGGGRDLALGMFKDGGWATHVLVLESQVLLLPDEVDLSHAALIEPISCLVHAWDMINPVTVGLDVLVLGAGLIGIMLACMLHLHGLRKTVTVSEPLEERQKMLPKLDLDYKVKSPEELKDDGFDLIVDCCGSAPAIQAALPLLKPGGRLCIFGCANPEAKLTISPFQVFNKELNIVGAKINPFSFPKALALLQAMQDRYIDFDKLGIKVYPLSEYREAFEAVRQGSVSKAIFKC